MTHSLITRLVVGEPTTLPLGRPVGQSLAGPSSAALRWKAGTWVGARTPSVEWLARVLRRRAPQAIVMRTAASPVVSVLATRNLAAAALAAVAIGAAIPLAMSVFSGAPAESGDLPIAPAAATAPVRVVAAPYVPPQPSQPAVAMPPLAIVTPTDAASPPLPFAPPGPAHAPVAQRADQPRTPPVPPERLPAPPAKAPERLPTPPAKAPERLPAPPAKAAGQKEQTPAPKNTAGNQREQQPISAVVLDEAAPRGGRPAANANPPIATTPTSLPAKQAPAAASVPAPATAANSLPAKQAASTAAAPALAVATQPAPQVALERGTGLIAITPDSKVAVFTNPKTRLPQQFKIGEQLLSGDTIRSIDAKAGKVISSSKEYNLD